MSTEKRRPTVLQGGRFCVRLVMRQIIALLRRVDADYPGRSSFGRNIIGLGGLVMGDSTTNGTNGFKVIGTRPIRHDGVDKVTGRAKYGADYAYSGGGTSTHRSRV